MHMFDVVKDSPEYQEALKRFHETIGQTVTIVSLKRIQNPVEYGKHVSLRELIAKKYQTKTPSIRQLFHGSSETCIQLIAVQGFNRSYAGDANGKYDIMSVMHALLTLSRCTEELEQSVVSACVSDATGTPDPTAITKPYLYRALGLALS